MAALWQVIDAILKKRLPDHEIGPYWGYLNVLWFGARGDNNAASAEGNTAAFAAAIEAAHDAGGGDILVPEGTFYLQNANPSAANWDNYRAIYIGYDNIRLIGCGRGSILKLATDADCHVIQIGQRVTTTVTVSGVEVRNLAIDGNRTNQTAPSDASDHWSGIEVESDCADIKLTDLYIHDCQYYGIGMQRDGIEDSVIDNVLIENTGADGIDWKNDTGSGTGNYVRNVVVRNFGLATGLTLPQAGVDLRSGMMASNITIETMTAEADLVGVRVQGDGDGTSTSLPTQPTKLHHIAVQGNDGASSIGVRIAARNTHLSDVFVRNCSDGMYVTRPDCRLSQIYAESGAGAGIRLGADPTAALEADTTYIEGAVIRSNGDGIVYDSVDEVTAIGCEVRSNTDVGHDIRTGSTGIKIIGGSCTGNGTDVSDSGTSTVIRNVAGVRTEQVITATGIAIDSTGSKTITFNHSLGFTPNASDVNLTLFRETAVDDWAADWLRVTSTSSTTITAHLMVGTASATGGAVVSCRAHATLKFG